MKKIIDFVERVFFVFFRTMYACDFDATNNQLVIIHYKVLPFSKKIVFFDDSVLDTSKLSTTTHCDCGKCGNIPGLSSTLPIVKKR